MDFSEGCFDLETIMMLSGSHSEKRISCAGRSVFVNGKKVRLFNAYDALEMALRDELLSTVSNQKIVDYVCETIMENISCAVEEVCDASDLEDLFAPTSLSEACVMEVVLPMKLVCRISSRLQHCLSRLCNLIVSEEFLLT